MSDVRFTDLSIHVRAAYSRQHILNGGPRDAPVPGWFARVTRNEGYDDVVGETALNVGHVLEVALAVDSVIWQIEGGAKTDRVVMAVTAADEAMLDRLRSQLRAAEAAAARIPHLKRLLGEE